MKLADRGDVSNGDLAYVEADASSGPERLITCGDVELNVSTGDDLTPIATADPLGVTTLPLLTEEGILLGVMPTQLTAAPLLVLTMPLPPELALPELTLILLL